MKITFRIEGGVAHFPGLAAPRVLDTEALPEASAVELLALVTGTGVWEKPPEPSRNTRPDARTYFLEIVDGPRTRSVTLTDPLPPGWPPLLRALEGHLHRRNP